MAKDQALIFKVHGNCWTWWYMSEIQKMTIQGQPRQKKKRPHLNQQTRHGGTHL
jgi:hypothetical protein